MPDESNVESGRTYVVRSMVRDVQTRTLRARSATRHRFTQRIGGGDISVKRGRSRTYPEAVIRTNLVALKTAVAEGRLLVETTAGVPVNLDTMEPLTTSGSLPNMTPNFPLDSADNDKNPKRPPKASTNTEQIPSEEAKGRVPDLLTRELEEAEPTPEEVAEPPMEEPSVEEHLEPTPEEVAEPPTGKKRWRK